jgi:hypothetical protein
MNTHAMNRNALDSRIAGSLAGLGKSRDALDEPVFLHQRKINGKDMHTTRTCVFPTDLSIFPVHRVHRVISLIGGGLQPNKYQVRSGSSREDFLKICLRSSYA